MEQNGASRAPLHAHPTIEAQKKEPTSLLLGHERLLLFLRQHNRGVCSAHQFVSTSSALLKLSAVVRMRCRYGDLDISIASVTVYPKCTSMLSINTA